MNLVVTPAMRTVIDHVGDLGSRWGLRSDTCAVHAMLYLAGQPMSAPELSTTLAVDADAIQLAITDLLEWRVVRMGSDGRLTTSTEAWDLLFAAMEERRRREIEPARCAFEQAMKSARVDGTPRVIQHRIAGLHGLVLDLSALGNQVGRMSSRTLTTMTGFASRALRAFDRR